MEARRRTGGAASGWKPGAGSRPPGAGRTGGSSAPDRRRRLPQPPWHQKTQLCRNFAGGQCWHGDTCIFAHGEGELQYPFQQLDPDSCEELDTAAGQEQLAQLLAASVQGGLAKARIHLSRAQAAGPPRAGQELLSAEEALAGAPVFDATYLLDRGLHGRAAGQLARLKREAGEVWDTVQSALLEAGSAGTRSQQQQPAGQASQQQAPGGSGPHQQWAPPTPPHAASAASSAQSGKTYAQQAAAQPRGPSAQSFPGSYAAQPPPMQGQTASEAGGYAPRQAPPQGSYGQPQYGPPGYTHSAGPYPPPPYGAQFQQQFNPQAPPPGYVWVGAPPPGAPPGGQWPPSFAYGSQQGGWAQPQPGMPQQQPASWGGQAGYPQPPSGHGMPQQPNGWAQASAQGHGPPPASMPQPGGGGAAPRPAPPGPPKPALPAPPQSEAEQLRHQDNVEYSAVFNSPSMPLAEQVACLQRASGKYAAALDASTTDDERASACKNAGMAAMRLLERCQQAYPGQPERQEKEELSCRCSMVRAFARAADLGTSGGKAGS